MKKIVKLTENDLTRIVKKVIKEQEDKDCNLDELKKKGIFNRRCEVPDTEREIKILNLILDDLNLRNGLDLTLCELCDKSKSYEVGGLDWTEYYSKEKGY